MLKKISQKGWVKIGIFSLIITSFLMTSGCAKLMEAIQKELDKQKDLSNVIGQTGDTQISGKIMYSKDNASYSLQYAKVDIRVNYSTGTKQYVGYTDNNGYYNVWIESLANSTAISVVAKAPGYNEKTEVLTAGTNYGTGQTSVRVSDIYLVENTSDTSLGVISGVVRYGPLPIVGATVNIVSGPSTNITAITDQNGVYVFPGLPYGDYTLSITKKDFIVLTKPGSITISASDKVKNDANFVLKPATAELEKQYDIAGIGVVNACFIYPDSNNVTSNIPAFITDATVKVISIKDDAGNYPKAIVKREDSSFVVYGIPISTNVTIELEITLDGNKFKQIQAQNLSAKTLRPTYTDTLIKTMTHTYSVSSRALVNDKLPEIQKVQIEKADFDFQTVLGEIGFTNFDTNFNFMDFIWVDNEVRTQMGSTNIPVAGAKVVFSKDGIRKEAITDQNGWFGLNLPSRGSWHIEIFANATDVSPVFIYDANIQNTFDSRSWYPGMIFIQGVKADVKNISTKRIEFQVKKQASTTINDPRFNYGNNFTGENYTGQIQFALYSVLNKEYKVTANRVSTTVNDGKYYADLAPLGDFKAEIISGDVKLVNTLDSYYINEWSGNYWEIWVKESNLAASGRVYVQYGTTEVGVPTATVELKKDGVAVTILSGSTEVTSTKTAVAKLSDAMAAGRYNFNFRERNDLEEDGWTLVISKPGVIKTKSIALWFERDTFGEMKSNLFTLDNIKVTPISYIGKYFPNVTGKLNSPSDTLDNIKGAAITLNYVGANLYVTGNTDSNGNFSLTNVPALDTELEVLVQKGTNIGKNDWTFRFKGNDISELNAGNFTDESAIIPWGDSFQQIWVQFTGFKLWDIEVKYRFNDKYFWVSGAKIDIEKTDDATVTASCLSDESGWFRGIYIPKNGSYKATITKSGFVDKVVYSAAAPAELSKASMATNYGWDQNSIKLELSTTADITTLGIPTKSIEGYVYEEVGSSKNALANITVTFTAAKETFSLTAVTDSNGKFTIGLPKIGEYKMTVSKTGLTAFEQSVWTDDWSSNSVNDAILRPTGATGWWSIPEFEFNSAVVYEDGLQKTETEMDNITPKIYYQVRAHIQKDGKDFDGDTAYNVAIVNADTGEKLYDMVPIAGAQSYGIWVATGSVTSAIFGNKKAFERSSALDVSKVRIEVKNATGYRIYPNLTNDWELQYTEKKLSSLMPVPNWITSTLMNGATTFTWDNSAFSESGTTGSKYRVKLQGLNSDNNSVQITYDRYIDQWNAYNTTLSWAMNGYDYCTFATDYNSLMQKYPSNIPAGSYKVYFITADDVTNPSRTSVITGTITNPVYK